jgi:hypothetical protein
MSELQQLTVNDASANAIALHFVLIFGITIELWC